MFSASSAYLVPLAQAPGGPGGLFGSPIIPLVLFLVIMYFLLIRPQNKKVKDHRELLNRLKAGDEIVTSGGIHGTITGVKENELQVRIAENVEITLARAAVSRLREEEDEGDAAPAQKGAKK